VGFAQGGTVADGVEVAHLAPGQAQFAGGGLQAEQDVLEGQLVAAQGLQRVEILLGGRQAGGEVGLDSVGRELAPADVKGGIEKRMVHARLQGLEK
jgi:hypothetical protein